MNRVITLIAVLFVASCSGDVAPLVATDVRLTAPMPGMTMSAGYLTLTNNTAETITISHVTSPEFGNVELHETIIEDGIARMAELDHLDIAAGASVVLEPGGKHLMLMQPVGDLQQVTLDFHADDAVALTVNVSIDN